MLNKLRKLDNKVNLDAFQALDMQFNQLGQLA